MASSAAAASGPLAFMQPLSPTVAYWDQDSNLALISTRDEHIAKYVTQHRVLFPSSRILLIRCPLSRVWLPWIARRDMKPAIPLLRALAVGSDGQKAEGTRPRVLVHTFSNGSIRTAIHLRAMLAAPESEDGDHGIAAPPRYVLLLDSCTGYFRWRKTHRALVQTLSWWASPLMHIAIAMACAYRGLRRLPPAQDQNACALRAPSLVSRECRRAYLYGTADDMVDYHDVEDNARKAEEIGFSVRQERFEGAEHVAIVKAESARYWAAVRESWEGARATDDGLKAGGIIATESLSESEAKTELE